MTAEPWRYTHSDESAEDGTCLCDACWKVAADEYEAARQADEAEHPELDWG